MSGTADTSARNQKILRSHFSRHRKFTALAGKIEKALTKLVDAELEQEKPDILRLEKLAVTLGHASKALDKAIAGERAALSLHHEDLLTAANAIRKAGYEIVEKGQLEELLKSAPEPLPETPEGGWINVECEDPEPVE